MKNQKNIVELVFGLVVVFGTLIILKVACD